MNFRIDTYEILKRVIKCSLVLCLIFSCDSNVKVEKSKDISVDVEKTEFQYEFESKNMIGLACGESGQSTRTVLLFSKLMLDSEYEKILQKLNSSIPAEKLLATIIIEKLSIRGDVSLNNNEKNQIETNKSSLDSISFCSGCTEFANLSSKDFFKSKNTFWLEEMNNWLSNFKILKH